MLERIALHQTRLRTPGLGLDGKGVALGAKGLVLLPSIDRLVALLSIYTRERSLEDLLPSLHIGVVRSKLGTRELTVEFTAESSDRMDRLADTARLVGGFAFTGTSRHFVQYRDAGAPFGYDAAELLPSEEGIVLYHAEFTQSYAEERAIELRALLLRLMPHVDPSTYDEPGARVIVAEQGLGDALIHYFVRSRVDGDVCVVEWPPASAFDDAPIRRTVVRLPELPARMRPLLYKTPGLVTFVPAGPGVAVEVGYRHPVELRACPVFDASGLMLLRHEGEPWTIGKFPASGPLGAFARVELREEGTSPQGSLRGGAPATVRLPLRVLPSTKPWRRVTATFLRPDEVPLLRKLAYALPHATIAQTQIAVTRDGAFVRSPSGIESIPLGTFFVELTPRLLVAAGHEVVPAVSPEVLWQALGAPSSQLIFLGRDARARAVEEVAFGPLETMLLEAHPWEPLVAETITRALDEKPIDLRIEALPMFPMRGVEAVGKGP